jgi:3-methyladenine DNA glycosylase AlkC
MYDLTQKFTAEFCIRPFINKYGDEIYDRLLRWNNDPNEHIRRWLSEGTRPRLPWGVRLQSAVQDPKRGLEILDFLKFDPSLYVRKSVANHLNDIAKDHPDLVVQTLRTWKSQLPSNFKKEFDFICNRALRSLIKSGHTKALNFSGINTNRNILRCSTLQLNKSNLHMNDKLKLHFVIHNTSRSKAKYIVDYVVYFMKSNGTQSPKVFKLKTGEISGGHKISIEKQIVFKPITTRKYYSGEHKIALKLNGIELKSKKFLLKL